MGRSCNDSDFDCSTEEDLNSDDINHEEQFCYGEIFHDFYFYEYTKYTSTIIVKKLIFYMSEMHNFLERILRRLSSTKSAIRVDVEKIRIRRTSLGQN